MRREDRVKYGILFVPGHELAADGTSLSKEGVNRLACALVCFATPGSVRWTHILVSGGRAQPHEQQTEASVMARYLIEKGIPEEAIICEEESRNSFESVRFSIRCLTQRFRHRDRTIAVVSGTHHAERVRIIFTEYGYTVCCIPVAGGDDEGRFGEWCKLWWTAIDPKGELWNLLSGVTRWLQRTLTV